VRMAIGSVDGQAELQRLWFTLGSLVERHAPTAHTAHGLASLPAAGFPAVPRIDRSWLVGGSISFCRPGLIAAPGVSRPLQEVSFDFTFFIFLIFLPLPSAGNHSRAREAQNKAFQRVGGGGEREGNPTTLSQHPTVHHTQPPEEESGGSGDASRVSCSGISVSGGSICLVAFPFWWLSSTRGRPPNAGTPPTRHAMVC